MKKGIWIWVGIGVLAALVVAGALWSASKQDGTGFGGLTGLGESTRTAGGTDGRKLPGVGGKTAGTSQSPTSSPQKPPAPTVTEPVAKGSKLVTITTPPARTLAFVDGASASPNSTYTVEFRVYGSGPGPAGSSVVIIVDKSTPVSGVAKPYDLTGRNVLVKLTAKAGQAVKVGGSYSGTLVLRKQQGDVLEPWLVDAKAK